MTVNGIGCRSEEPKIVEVKRIKKKERDPVGERQQRKGRREDDETDMSVTVCGIDAAQPTGY